MATALLGIPGVILATILMNHVSRRAGVVLAGCVCALCAGLLKGLSTGQSSALLGVVGFKLFFPTWQMTTMLLPSELFGTQIRSWAFSSTACFGRFATIVCPMAVALGPNAFTVIL